MAPALDISAPVVSSPPYEPNKSSVVSNVSDKDPEVVVYDWDKDELDIVGRCGLKYTIRSSKYPRTVQRPARTTILLNSAHAFSVHTILLTAFSKTLAVAISTQPTAPHLVKLKLSGPISSLPAWTLFLDWLYTLDKIPLPDFTPLRPPSTTTSTLVSAALLASHLHAVKFEKYLLRVIYKELWDGVFPVSSLEVLRDNMGHDTGMWYFSTGQ
ncbi:hypothetical protein M011DRAFT_112202 [Sporormia fimetaria CBS 119925]|uniref:BTB domain-containing protein n=1 Tax=Sporormia fimetaria CBS 119925 TaxID=1340428 RepID=A0A6A6VL87_9PLEO|nr:hypothetical protein M011DRAFT_112202 [Sporormia fimetaria CBS 119925]